MRIVAGVLVLILGYFSSGFTAEELGLVDGPFSFWFVMGPWLALSVLCSVFTFMAKYWKLCLVLAFLFGGIIPAFLIYQSRSDWEQ